MSAWYRMPGYGDAATWGGRTPDYEDEDDPQIAIPRWMARDIQYELEKAGGEKAESFARILASAIACSKKRS